MEETEAFKPLLTSLGELQITTNTTTVALMTFCFYLKVSWLMEKDDHLWEALRHVFAVRRIVVAGFVVFDIYT